jgi:SET domain-containing protein 6
MGGRDALDDDFRAWARARGIAYDDARCAVRGDDARGRSVECACALANGTTLATIPKSACLTTTTSALGGIEDVRARGVVGLCVAVAHERALGAKSTFAAYLKTLPAREALPSTFAAEHEARRALRGTTVEGMLEADAHAIEDDYHEFASEMEKPFARHGVKMPTLDEFRDAATIVASRAFFVDDSLGQGLVPFADLFNHKGGSDGAHFNVVGCDDVDVDALTLVSCREAKPGEELFNSFGDDHDNNVLFYKYGFVERDNRVDKISFNFGSWSLRNIGDTVFESVHDWMTANYDGVEELDIDADGAMSRPLLALLRIVSFKLLNETESGATDDDATIGDLLERTMTGDESEAEILEGVLDDVVLTLFRSRLNAYLDAEEHSDCDEDVSSILRDVALEIKRSVDLATDASRVRQTFGTGISGVAAAHHIRADELGLLMKAIIRAFDMGEEEDDEDTRDAKKPKLVEVVPAYAPTIYIKPKE